MKLLSKKEVKKESQDETKRLEADAVRLKDFVAKEIKRYNEVKDRTEATKALMEADTNEFLDLKVAEKQAILAEIQVLEEAKRVALEPIIDRENAIRHAENGLDLRESRNNLKEHDLEVYREDLSERMASFMVHKTGVDLRDQKLDLIESQLVTRSDYLNRASGLLDSKWKEYNERVVSEQLEYDEKLRLLGQEKSALTVLSDLYETLLKDFEKREQKLAFDQQIFKREYDIFYGRSSKA
jgi:hypothetical protein